MARTTSRSNSGLARAAALTPEERTAIARKAAAARWAKARAATVTVFADSGQPKVTVDAELVKVYQSEPIITMGDETWNVHSRSYAISPKGQGESYTQ